MSDPTTAEARAVGILGADGWPYGPNVDEQARRALVTWATPQRLRYSPRGRCLHWLRTGRCNGSRCTDYRDHRWLDHVTGWTRNGRPAVLLGQPYALSGGDFGQFAELERSGLSVTVNGDGWYGHGTVAVEILPASNTGDH